MLALAIVTATGLVAAFFYFRPPQITPVSRGALAKLNEEEWPLE